MITIWLQSNNSFKSYWAKGLFGKYAQGCTFCSTKLVATLEWLLETAWLLLRKDFGAKFKLPRHAEVAQVSVNMVKSICDQMLTPPSLEGSRSSDLNVNQSCHQPLGA